MVIKSSAGHVAGGRFLGTIQAQDELRADGAKFEISLPLTKLHQFKPRVAHAGVLSTSRLLGLRGSAVPTAPGGPAGARGAWILVIVALDLGRSFCAV